MRVVFSVIGTDEEVATDLPFLPIIGHAVSFVLDGDEFGDEYEIKDVGYSIDKDGVLEYVIAHVESV